MRQRSSFATAHCLVRIVLTSRKEETKDNEADYHFKQLDEFHVNQHTAARAGLMAADKTLLFSAQNSFVLAASAVRTHQLFISLCHRGAW